MDGVTYVQPGSDYLKVDNSQTKNEELDKNAFIKLLITQMKYQDPLNPMDNQEMMAQLAQFSALEQMQNVANMAEKQYAHGLLGQVVEFNYTDSETGLIQQLFGTVDYVKTNGSTILIGIGDKEIELSNITKVVNPNSVQKNFTAYELIGKTVQATYIDNQSKEVFIVEGTVLSVKMNNGNPYVVIGNGNSKLEIDLQNVHNVVESSSLIGKTVTANTVNKDGENIIIEGIVQYVYVKSGTTYLSVNDTIIDFNDIETIN